jgi:hypothetical protein
MAEDMLLGAAVADAGDHRGMVALVREHSHARQFARQGRQRRVVRDIARRKNQRRLAPMQVGKLALEQQVNMAGAGDIARAAGAAADCPQCFFHCREDRRVLPHAEIIVRAPDQ